MDHSTYLQRQPDAAKLKTLKIASWVVSFVVLTLVAVMGKYQIDIGVDLSFLPPVHALLNTTVAISLLIAVMAIKNKNVQLHKRAIGVAVVCSTLFLLCYVTYHGTQGEVKFGGDGVIRTVYLSLLLSHILLAAISLPFILITLALGYTNHFAAHKKMARWVFPLWLYVAATGPICYLMLKPYY
ncbi:MAG: DUF420 domain-containing protein [Akkermansiaceae bacterium]